MMDFTTKMLYELTQESEETLRYLSSFKSKVILGSSVRIIEVFG